MIFSWNNLLTVEEVNIIIYEDYDDGYLQKKISWILYKMCVNDKGVGTLVFFL